VGFGKNNGMPSFMLLEATPSGKEKNGN